MLGFLGVSAVIIWSVVAVLVLIVVAVIIGVVPMGVWVVGEDIPVGHWTIKTNASYATVLICDALDATGKGADIWNSDIYKMESIASPNGLFFDPISDRTEIDFNLKKGMYVIIDGGNVIFSPYAGKPSLGFK